MEVVHQTFGNWEIECMPHDGGRISVLRYKDYNLLSTAPPAFRPPAKDYGEYEMRPVFGYDDCFPSVSSCEHPTLGFQIKDHGDLCWLGWQVEVKENKLICSTVYDKFRIQFNRTLEFRGNVFTWKFDIVNLGKKQFEFLHIVHPLMPLNEIVKIELPDFNNASRRTGSVKSVGQNPMIMNSYLMNIPPGNFEMLYLSNVREGKVVLHFKNGIKLQMDYDAILFPTLGIWWNNSGYPEEPGIERCECAFEPIPGTGSDLKTTFNDQQFLIVDPGKTFSWDFTWIVDN